MLWACASARWSLDRSASPSASAARRFARAPVPRAVRREAPVRQDPGLLAHGGARLPRHAVVALGVRPVAATVVDLREPVLEARARGGRRLGRRGLVALDRAPVVAMQHVHVADRGCRPDLRRLLVAQRAGLDLVM